MSTGGLNYAPRVNLYTTQAMVNNLQGFCVSTNIIEPGYTRSCTRISKLM